VGFDPWEGVLENTMEVRMLGGNPPGGQEALQTDHIDIYEAHDRLARCV